MASLTRRIQRGAKRGKTSGAYHSLGCKLVAKEKKDA